MLIRIVIICSFMSRYIQIKRKLKTKIAPDDALFFLFIFFYFSLSKKIRLHVFVNPLPIKSYFLFKKKREKKSIYECRLLHSQLAL